MSICVDNPTCTSGYRGAPQAAPYWPGEVWDRWYDHSKLPDALKRKLSVHDMKMLAYQASDAFKPEYDAVLATLRKLTQAARTSGGTAGPDADLMAVCEDAEKLLLSRRAP